MLMLLMFTLCANPVTLSPAQTYLAWLDAYHQGNGKGVYELYNTYGQNMCAERAVSKDEAELARAALFFACRLLYQEDLEPSQERINAKHNIVAQEQIDDKSWMLHNADGDLVILMNEGKGWKVDNVFPKNIWEKKE